jgi:PD-(D/E)XK endonuclease
MVLLGKEKLDAKRKGHISESAIITKFLQCGYMVLTPYGGSERYDLVIEDAERQFWRVQCKSAWIDNGETVLKFDTANHNVIGVKRDWRHYREQCDYFAVYSEELNKVYLVPVDEVGTTRAHLRLEPSKNGQEKNVRWAKNYELSKGMGPAGVEPATNQVE